MTIRETVKQALTQVPGNKPFDLESWKIPHTLGTISEMHCINDIPERINVLGPKQLRGALRDIPYVRKLADGRYVVKGRKVPPKVDITTS